MENYFNPKVSVLMGVFNCEDTVVEAIDSILNQTMRDFEFIICDDGSTDHTWDKLNEMAKQDSRIVLFRNDSNLGLNKTLNLCANHASGIYFARMDGDDICSKNRFEEELYILENSTKYSIVSCWMNLFDENGEWGCVKTIEVPSKNDFVNGTPFVHAASMFKKDSFNLVGGYSIESFTTRVEDFNLWIKMYSHDLYGYNIQKQLYQMRDDRNAVKRRKFKYRLYESYQIIYAIITLKLPIYLIFYAIIPFIKGLLPTTIYNMIRKIKRVQ
jgi:glycosyltransferase EpsE